MERSKSKSELVFIPSLGIGHIVSTIEFANLLLERSERLSITVLVMNAGNDIKTNLASHTKIRFIELPYVESNKTCVKEAIVKHVLPNSSKLLGLVLDLFCTSMIEVGNELGVPSYLFFTGGAAGFGFLLYLSLRHDREGREFVRSESEPIIPGFINPIPLDVLPGFLFNKERYMPFVNLPRRFKETKGILVNSFLDLEPNVVSSLISTYHDWPPVYTVGPLINHKNQNPMKSKNHDEIIKWLDEQPESSVVFLCFGSGGCFRVTQLKEIAKGLEKSGHRFLWSIRVASEDNRKIENIDHREILPKGFLERTKGKGFTCGWAPQVEVLAHKAVGGFVSHCGWNSILESLWFGVPILTWPLYAEQTLNAFQMVKDLGLAFELKLDSSMFSDEIVKRDEIAKGVKSLMEEDSEVRKRVREMSVKGRKALIAGGSSYDSVGHWIETLLGS